MVLLSVVFNYDDAIRLSAFPSLLTYVAVNRWSTVIYDNHLTPRNRMSRGLFPRNYTYNRSTRCDCDNKLVGSSLYSCNVTHPSSAIPKSLALPLLKSAILSCIADCSGVLSSLVVPLFHPLSVAESSGVMGRCLRGRFEKCGSRCPLAGRLVPAMDILHVTPRRVRRDSELEMVLVRGARVRAGGVEGDDNGEE